MNLTKFWAGALVVALALVVACSTATPPPASNTGILVPSDANLIAEIQVGKILQDVDLRSLYAQAPKDADDPQTLEEALDLAFEESGIDFRSFRSVVLFSDVARAEDYFGVIATGEFDEDRLIAAMALEGDFTFADQDYKGVRLHVDESDPDAPVIAVLDSSILIAGTLPAVQSVLDVRDGTLPPMSGQVYDTFNALGTPLIRMAVTVPPEVLSELINSAGGGLGFAPAAMTSLQDLKVFAMMADKNGEALQLRTDLDFATPASATQMGEMLQGLISLASGFSPDPNVAVLLNKLDIDVVEGRLTFNFQTTVSELAEISESMGQGMAGIAR